jgi:DNA-binding response OmpR family regulator
MTPNRARAHRVPRAEPTLHAMLRRATRPPVKGDRRALTAQLYLSPAGMVRLLSVSGTQSEFILSAVDGRTTVRVGLSVSSVPDSQLAIGHSGVVLDWSRSTLGYRGSAVRLTHKELRLLLALLEYAPEPAPNRALIAALWDGNVRRSREKAYLAALPVWVCTLRRRVAAIGLPNAVRTVRRVGYALAL